MATSMNPAWTPQPDRVLHHIMNLLDVSDQHLGDVLGVTRQTVRNRRTAKRGMSADDITNTAAALGVDPRVFFGPPSEAIRWVVDNQADRLDDDNGGGPGTVVRMIGRGHSNG